MSALTSTPSDWQVRTLAELGGRVTSGSRAWAANYADHGALFVRITNLDRRDIHLDLANSKYVQVDPADPEARRTLLASGDLLISITADIGIIGYIDGRVPSPAYINQHIARVRLDPKLADSKFVAYYLSSWGPQREFVGATDQGAKAGMNLAAVASLTTVVPPREEQEQIARALADVDGLVDSVERLIAKKRAIRHGMMQELLSGRRRIAGFTGEWREAPLSEVSTLKGRIGWQGLKQTEFTNNSSEPYLITGMNFKDGAIRWSEVYHVSDERYEIAPEIQLRTGDVLMTKDGTIGKLLYVDHIPSPGKATLNSHLLLFRPKGGAYDPRFLYYQLGSPRFLAHVEESKSGTTFFGISQAAVGKYLTLLPPIDEQRAIGEALQAADDEIAALERRLEASRVIKQGMMQELLTGRTRLVPTENAA